MSLPLRVRISSDFVVAITALVLVTAIALIAFERARASTALIRENLTPSVATTTEIKLAIQEMDNAEWLLFPGAPQGAAAEARFREGAERFEAAFLDLQPLARGPRERELLLSLERDYRRFAITHARIRAALEAGNVAEALRLNTTDSLALTASLRENTRAFRLFNLREIEEVEAAMQRFLTIAEVAMGLVGLLGALLGVMLWRRSSRAIVEPLRALQKTTHAISQGQYAPAQHPEASRTTEIAALQDDFNRMAGQLQAFSASLQEANTHLEARVAAQTQDLTRMVEELQGVDRVKSSLLAVMSHELLTPLNFITGYGSALEDELMGPLRDEQRQAVAAILQGADRLTRMIRNVLEYSKIGAGELTVLPEEVDHLTELLRDAADLIREATSGRQQLFQLDLPERLPPVLVDPSRLQQVLFELLDNAVKFTGPGGRITLRASPSEEAVWIEVVDTGVGIPEEATVNLLRPFFQVDLSSTRAHGGLGLGLPIAHHLVTRMGGTLLIDSRLGQGSTVRFALPRSDVSGGPNRQPAEQLSTRPPRGGGSG